jgi:hypothetical protein
MIEGKDISLDIESDEEAKAAIGNLVKSTFNNEKIKDYGRWALYSVKAEITMHELRQCLYWQSVLEIAVMTFSFFLLMILTRFIIFLQIFHFIRPILCFKVISSLPKSHEIYEELPNLSDSSAMQPIIFSHFQRGNKFISRYLLITVIAFILDIIGCIISFTFIGGNKSGDGLYSSTVWLFLCFDVFLVFWYNTMRWEYPEEIWQNIRNVLKEGLQSTQAFLSNFMQSVRNRFR